MEKGRNDLFATQQSQPAAVSPHCSTSIPVWRPPVSVPVVVSSDVVGPTSVRCVTADIFSLSSFHCDSFVRLSSVLPVVTHLWNVWSDRIMVSQKYQLIIIEYIQNNTIIETKMTLSFVHRKKKHSKIQIARRSAILSAPLWSYSRSHR